MIKNFQFIIVIFIIFLLNSFLVGQINCLPLDIINKLFENMEKNPTKSGFFLQLLYFVIVCYFEYSYDYWDSKENVQNKE